MGREGQRMFPLFYSLVAPNIYFCLNAPAEWFILYLHYLQCSYFWEGFKLTTAHGFGWPWISALVLDGMSIFGPIGCGQEHRVMCALSEKVGVHCLLCQRVSSWEKCSQLLALELILRRIPSV